jgi:hypothetical protein
MYDTSVIIVRWENNLKPLKPCYTCVSIGLPCQCMYDKSVKISGWELLTRVAFGLVGDLVEKVLSYKNPAWQMVDNNECYHSLVIHPLALDTNAKMYDKFMRTPRWELPTRAAFSSDQRFFGEAVLK